MQDVQFALPAWMQPWATCSRWSYLSRTLDQMDAEVPGWPCCDSVPLLVQADPPPPSRYSPLGGTNAKAAFCSVAKYVQVCSCVRFEAWLWKVNFKNTRC